jgi:DNA (cytosine-5)-methyltransferase 1
MQPSTAATLLAGESRKDRSRRFLSKVSRFSKGAKTMNKRRMCKGNAPRSQRKIYALDVFCGAGGLTHGLESVGIDVRLGIDIDPACRYPYLTNNGASFLQKRVEELTCDEVMEFLPPDGIRLLAGCAPCQTFSTYNQKATPHDDRWWLLRQFSRIAREIRPELVTMENVPRLQYQGVFQEFVSVLKEGQYHVDVRTVDCSDYGIAQSRKRLVLLASRLGPIELMAPTVLKPSLTTVREVISCLPPLRAGQTNQEDPLHQASALSTLNMERIKASRQSGTWRDWDEGLVASCHKKSTGKTYSGVYGRMHWDQPSPTITTQFFGFGNGRFGHPEQDRAISIREGAMLQSFPRHYRFVEDGHPIHKKTVGRLIGNAVPPRLGQAIGLSIQQHVMNWLREQAESDCGRSEP